MLVLFLVCALIPVCVLGLFSYTAVQRQLDHQQRDSMRRITKASGLWLYDRLLSIEDTVALLANAVNDPKVGETSLGSQIPGLTDRLLSVSIQAPGEATRALFGPSITNVDPSQRELAHLDAGNTLLRVQAGPGARGQIVLARRILASAQRPARLLVAEPHPDYLWRFSEESDTRVCVTDLDLSFLHCPYPPRREATEALLESLETAVSGHLEVEDSGSNQYHYWSLFLGGHFQAPSWVVLSQHDPRNSLSVKSMFVKVFPAILALALMIVLLLSLVQIRRLTDPLVQLIAATRRIAGGQFDSRVEVNSNDEFEALGESFNAMTDSLKQTFSTLEGLAEIDRVILTAPDVSHVLDTLASKLTGLTTCQRAALALFDTRTMTGSVRYVQQRIDFRPGHDVHDLDEDSRAAMLSRRESAVVAAGELLPALLEPIRGASGAVTAWVPVDVDSSLRALIACTFDNPAQLDALRLRHINDLGDRLRVAVADARKNETLRRQANHDGLTGLANRNKLNEVLAQLVEEGQSTGSKFALLFIDLDRFKSINDTMGHSVGDEFLKQMADRLTTILPDAALLARFGGDEFVCLLRAGERGVLTQTRAAARKIMLAINEPFELGTRELTVTTSLGISIYPQDGVTGSELLKSADIALYHAKSRGKDTWAYFTDAMNRDAARRMEIDLALREALNRGELCVEYQPQVSLKTGRVEGVEALLRWPTCPLGAIGPAQFIPVAEESRLVIDLGAWVLREACAQARRWLDQGMHGLVMSVNLAPRHFLNQGLPAQIAEALRHNNLQPSVLEVEVTESSIMEDIETASEVLANLRAMGVRVAVDDFGTGHSSLEYLAQLPASTLKVDRVFVRDAITKPGSKAIVETVIALAHKLGMTVTAEGVETEEQLQLMRDNGCDLVQGYFFCRPLPAEDFSRWWSHRVTMIPTALQAVAPADSRRRI